MDENLTEPLFYRFEQIEVQLLACQNWAQGRAVIKASMAENLNVLLDAIAGDEDGDPSAIATVTTMFQQLVAGGMDEVPWAEYRDELVERMRQAVAESYPITYH